jgi:hypothetical protein
MVLLVTSDNEQFVVDKDVAQHSALLKPFAESKSYLRSTHLIRRPQLTRDGHRRQWV